VITDKEFAEAMAAVGPFEPAPRIAAGVSGGADSLALALLAHDWARARGGSLKALVVDHGLRRESDREASETTARLCQRGIDVKILVINDLHRGPALAERARASRFAALEAACAEAGILHLLLGHHASDQAETLQIRALSGSGLAGMAGMASIVERRGLRLLHPLLTVPPGRLRATLTAFGVAWVEDPSNIDPSASRPRLRLLRRDYDGVGSATAALVAASMASGRHRAGQERRTAASLAECVAFRREGFALLRGQPLAPVVLAAVIQTIAGAPFPPSTRSVSALASAPRPATLAGVRLLPAGRLGPGLLAVREFAAMAPPVAAQPGVVWDGRFRLGAKARPPADATLGALGDDAARLRRLSPLPSAVLRTLPAIRHRFTLLAVPHLFYANSMECDCFPMLFDPPRSAASAPFWIGDASRAPRPYVDVS
jgi:tRNA(Ile)-lysidine synthase